MCLRISHCKVCPLGTCYRLHVWFIPGLSSQVHSSWRVSLPSVEQPQFKLHWGQSRNQRFDEISRESNHPRDDFWVLCCQTHQVEIHSWTLASLRWKSAVKSFKNHLKCIIGDVKLTYEEINIQIEACLNSWPLIPVDSPDDDSIEVLTSGHFLIGQPRMSLLDPSFSYQTVSLLWRWHLCQQLTHHFWKHWSSEYSSNLQKCYKWQYPTRCLHWWYSNFDWGWNCTNKMAYSKNN